MKSKNQIKVCTVTKKDLRVDYFKCGGPGGQKVNKTSSGVRFTHEPSGVVVQSTESRKRSENEKICLRKLAEHPKFIAWAKRMAAEDTQDDGLIQQNLDKAMLPFNLKTEVWKNKKWVSKSEIELE